MPIHPESWDDMSNYLVHFTKGGTGANDYSAMMGICSGTRLKAANKFGIARDKAPAAAPQEAVCFSEIPPGQWKKLEWRRKTKYGIGFTKEFVLSKGGAPIWYAWKDTAHWRALTDMMSRASSKPDDPIWKITPMIDSPGVYGRSRYVFDWEREWRHIGDMNFETEDVAFLLIPEELHLSARGFFENALEENLGPAFLCPYVDPSWDRSRILSALNAKR